MERSGSKWMSGQRLPGASGQLPRQRPHTDGGMFRPAGPGPGERASCGDSHLVINSTSDSVSDAYPDNRGVDRPSVECLP